MKILQIDKFLDVQSSRSGGVGRYISVLSQKLRSFQNDVYMFGCRTDNTQPACFPDYFDFTKTRNPFALFRMISNSQAAEKLREFLADKSIDVAHLHNLYHHLTPAILPVLKNAKIPSIMTLHDYRLACPTRHFYRADGLCTRCVGRKFHHAVSSSCAGFKGLPLAIESAFQMFLHRYDKYISKFICPNEFMISVMEKSGIAKNKLTLLRNIVAPQEAEPLNPDKKSLLYIGRLSREKGVDLLIEAARFLPSDIEIIIAGDGEMRSGLEEKISQNKFINIKLLGHVDSADLSKLYQQSNIVVITSRCMENCPAVMLEAMKANRCVVVSEQPPLLEWIEDKKTGRVFEIDNPKSLAEVCSELLGDFSQVSKLAAAGREKVLAETSSKSHVGKILELYKGAIGQ